MARKGQIENNKKRRMLIERYAQRRQQLRHEILEEADVVRKVALVQKLAKLPRNSASVRFRRRCALTGRSRGNNRATGFCRMVTRLLISAGFLPGFVKSS